MTVSDDIAIPLIESHPALTTGIINGVNGGVQNMIGGTIGGAAVGAVKGGWVDYIIKERELSNNPENTTSPTVYCK